MSDQDFTALQERLDAMGDAISRRAEPVPAAVSAAVGRRAAPALAVRWTMIGLGVAAAAALGATVFMVTRPSPRTGMEPSLASAPSGAPTMASLYVAARRGDPAAVAQPDRRSGIRAETVVRAVDAARPERLRKLLTDE